MKKEEMTTMFGETEHSLILIIPDLEMEGQFVFSHIFPPPKCTLTRTTTASDDCKMLYIAGIEKSAQNDGKDFHCVFLFEFVGSEEEPKWEYAKTFYAYAKEDSQKFHYGYSLACSSDGKNLAIGCPAGGSLRGWIEIHRLDKKGNWAMFLMPGEPGDTEFGKHLQVIEDVLYVGRQQVLGIMAA